MWDFFSRAFHKFDEGFREMDAGFAMMPPPTPRAPVLCPVCKGKTTVPIGFYPEDKSQRRPKCRSCGGRGVL